MFVECHQALPRTIVMDGDVKIRSAIQAIAQESKQEIAILLCVWHLHTDVEKQLLKKSPGVDVFALKKAFYELRGCATEGAFEEKWVPFLATYGPNEKASRYLQTQLYDQRELWVLAWTGRTFCGGMGTTGISESLHSLIASGKSAVNTLGDVLVLIDCIVIMQCDKTLKRTAKHEKTLEELTMQDLVGFVAPSVSTLLSGQAWKRMLELNVSSCFVSVNSVDRADAFVTRSWRATDLRFETGTVHVVSQLPDVPLSAGCSRSAAEIRRVLSKNVDLGRQVCASCRSADNAEFEAGGGFQLPARWELLYDGIYARKCLCIALGFNIPKEAGSTNNSTHEGLLDTLKLYVSERDRRQKGSGMDEREAHVETRNAMRMHVHGGRALGTPRYATGGLWVQCGVLDGEDAVPEAERRHYCGLWFHACCVGLVRAPKKKDERVQCLQCMQDARFRVKPPKVEHVTKLALWDAQGAPRILHNEIGGRVPTLFLTCTCELAVGTGLPCEGMLAAARACGAILSFRHYNTHWFGGKMIEFDAPAAVFDKNKNLQLNVGDVIDHQGQEEAPSHVPENTRPKRAKVVADPSAGDADMILVVTEGGTRREGGTGLEGVEAGDAKSGRKKSRRHKSKTVSTKK
jgi:hypothetical protein